MTSDNGEYEIEKVCAKSDRYELALAKANMPAKPIVKKYRFNLSPFNNGKRLVYITRKDGEIIGNYRNVGRENYQVDIHFIDSIVKDKNNWAKYCLFLSTQGIKLLN